MLIFLLLATSMSKLQFLQLDTDDLIPVFSTVLTYESMGGDMTVDQIADFFDLTLITPSEDAEGLSLSDIEGTDDIEELEEIAEDSDNPAALSLI